MSRILSRTLLIRLALISSSLVPCKEALAFCGLYVAKADTRLFNKASQVVMVRNEDRTVLSMANDFKGDLREFAIVIPVPTFIERGQIHVGETALIDHLDAYSAPRLVEYFDPDPCAQVRYEHGLMAPSAAARADMGGGAAGHSSKSLGVTVEAEYTIGEYDILILSAQESEGLEIWLRENGYRIPTGASAVLGSYIKQKMRFFVAKVNLKLQAQLGFSFLRPLQVAYESPKFMLPIRLGMVNADGAQDLFIYALTKNGRVETTNYRTTKLPTGMQVPEYVKEDFKPFYKDLFSEQVRKEDMRTVFLEYAWNMGSCDPCSAEPLSTQELLKLGVFWLADDAPPAGGAPAYGRRPPPRPMPSRDVYLSRLHVRYDGAHFPEDLVFQETNDRSTFQGRYVLQHPFSGSLECPAGAGYKEQVRQREEQQAQTLASLTGWNIGDIRRRMNLGGSGPTETGDKKWFQKLWKE
jgi:hypothetical protein